jgi:DNA-binding response OmpR family regulator
MAGRTPPLNLLIVEDDPLILESYQSLLGDPRLKDQFQPIFAKSAEEAITCLRNHIPHLVILDLSLPGKDGIVVLDAIRSDPRTKYAMVFVVTSFSAKAIEVEAFESGADDYLTKPFNKGVLVTRLLNLIRRQKEPVETQETVRLKNLRLEMPKGRLWIGTKSIDLHHKEARVLKVFMKHADSITTQEDLWDKVWGYASDNFRNTLHVTIASLRKKMGPLWMKRLETIKDQGYVLHSD